MPEKPMKACKKRRYRDNIAALFALERIQNGHDRADHKPIRAYQCSKCKGWHLTSMPYKGAQ